MFAKKFQSILLLAAIVGICVVESKTMFGDDETKEFALKTAKEMIERGEKVLEKLPKDDELFSKIEHDVKKFKEYKELLEKPDTPPTTQNRMEVFIFTLEVEFLPVLEQAEKKIKNITDKPTTGKPTTAAPTTGKPTTASSTTGKPTAEPTTAKPTAKPTTAKPTAAPTTAKPTAAPTTGKPSEAPTTAKPTAAPTTAKPTAAPTTSKSVA